jgi:hypothetical protein
LAPIVRVQNHGGVLLRVGTGNHSKKIHLYPALQCIVADNQGAHSACCCKTGSTKYPCRLCMVDNHSIFFDLSCGLRDPKNVLHNQHIAWRGVCKQIRGIVRNEAEIQAENWCQDMSIHPVPAAVFNLIEPYPGHNPYCYFWPDYLHTVLGGIMRNWIFSTATILERVGTITHIYT